MFRPIILVFAIIAILCCIIGLGLAAANKRGFFTENGLFVTNNVLAAFGMLGNCLGIVSTAFLLAIVAKAYWNKTVVIVWIFLSGITLYFLAGASAMWAEIIYLSEGYATKAWPAELAFEVASSILFIMLMCFVVSTLRTKEKETSGSK